jgi:hypothetical protein
MSFLAAAATTAQGSAAPAATPNSDRFTEDSVTSHTPMSAPHQQPSAKAPLGSADRTDMIAAIPAVRTADTHGSPSPPRG